MKIKKSTRVILLHVLILCGFFTPHAYTMHEGNENLQQIVEDLEVAKYRAYDDEFRAYENFLPPLKKMHLRDSKALSKNRLMKLGTTVGLGIISAALLWSARSIYLCSKELCPSDKFVFLFGCGVMAPFCALGGLGLGLLCASYSEDILYLTRKNYLNSAYNMRGLLNARGVRGVKKIDIHARDAQGKTLLMKCCDQNWSDDHRKFESSYDNIGRVSVGYRSSFMHALIGTGADINAVDTRGNNALISAMSMPPYLDVQPAMPMVKMLLAAGADTTSVLEYLKQKQQESNERIAALPAGIEMGFEEQQLQETLRAYIPLFEHPETMFKNARRPERMRFMEMLRERAASLQEPQLHEAVNQYVRTGFQDSLKKWCNNYTVLKDALHEGISVAPLVSIVSEYVGTYNKNLLDQALHVAHKRNNRDQSLVDALRACGAQDYSQKDSYRYFEDEFRAYGHVLPAE